MAGEQYYEDAIEALSAAGGTDEAHEVAEALVQAFQKYVERNKERQGVWRRSGIKGQCFGLMAKAERAFQQAVGQGEPPNVDHFRDAIIYAVFGWILVSGADTDHIKSDMNGSWPWEADVVLS